MCGGPNYRRSGPLRPPPGGAPCPSRTPSRLVVTPGVIRLERTTSRRRGRTCLPSVPHAPAPPPAPPVPTVRYELTAPAAAPAPMAVPTVLVPTGAPTVPGLLTGPAGRRPPAACPSGR